METQAKPQNNRFLKSTIITGVIILLWVLFRVILPNQPTIFAGSQPNNIGIINNQLASCPLSPNCVSNFSQDAEHYIAPISYNSPKKDTLEKLTQVINSLERTKIITVKDNYLYVQFNSFLMGYVDDVEFLLDESKKVINVRSASRIGESDLGVNKQRIETIRKQIN